MRIPVLLAALAVGCAERDEARQAPEPDAAVVDASVAPLHFFQVPRAQTIRHFVAVGEHLFVAVESYAARGQTTVLRVPLSGAAPEVAGVVPEVRQSLVWSGDRLFTADQERRPEDETDETIWRLDGEIAAAAWDGEAGRRCNEFAAYGATVVTAARHEGGLVFTRHGAEPVTFAVPVDACPDAVVAQADGTVWATTYSAGAPLWRARVDGTVTALLAGALPAATRPLAVEGGVVLPVFQAPDEDGVYGGLDWRRVSTDGEAVEALLVTNAPMLGLRAFQGFRDGFVGVTLDLGLQHFAADGHMLPLAPLDDIEPRYSDQALIVGDTLYHRGTRHIAARPLD